MVNVALTLSTPPTAPVETVNGGSTYQLVSESACGSEFGIRKTNKLKPRSVDRP